MTTATWLWVAWLGLFLVLEGRALVTAARGDTLSETVWRFIQGSGPRVRLRRVLLLFLLCWLLVHLLSGGWV